MLPTTHLTNSLPKTKNKSSHNKHTKKKTLLKYRSRVFFYLRSPLSLTTNSHRYHRLEAFGLPNSLKTIRNNAFELSPIASIVIPDSVETIGDSAFINSNLTSITIGKSVKSIGSYAFGYVYAKSVTIPKSVNLSSDAFASAPTKINRS